ncbi:hypothetical protein H4S07_006032, partial [Coemansia furcata]
MYNIGAGDIAEFRQNSDSINWNVSKVLSFPKATFELLAKINEFRNLAERDPEAPYVIDNCRPSPQWPPNGKIEFRDFSMKYGADLGYALKNVNDISEFGVGDYRARLGMIPQESSMMDGSIRYNLDPLNEYDIEEMWSSLIKCNIAKAVSPHRGSYTYYARELDDDSEEEGGGQKQLFGLCRVVMRKRKIVVLDEATANIDLETDKSVQELIRKEFRDCT